MATLFQDGFARADGTDLGVDWDATYTDRDAAQLVTNRVRAITLDIAARESVGTYSPPNDQWAEVKLATIAGTVYVSGLVMLRAAAPPTMTMYECEAIKNDLTFTSRIRKRVAGTPTTIATENATTWASGDVLYGSVQGTTITLSRNGTQVLSVTDAELTSGRVGLEAFVAVGGSLADLELDDFATGNFELPPPTTDFGGYRPHYQGYGVTTAGGRGGTLLRVTNLNDSGAGSLRAALEATGSRCVVFETSGTITLLSPISITSGLLTIAGQTAPSPGISIRRYPIYVNANDVVIQHLRLRVGDEDFAERLPAIYLSQDLVNPHTNIVLDHVSIAWSISTAYIGGNGSTLTPNQDVSVLDCLIAFGLAKGALDPSYTGQAAGALGTFARNLFVHNSHRQPLTGGAPGQLSLINNVIYGSGSDPNGGFDPAFGWGMTMPQNLANLTGEAWRFHVAAENNVYLASPYANANIQLLGTHASEKPFTVGLNANELLTMYLSGNTGQNITLGNQWGGVNYFGAGATEALIRTDTVPSWHSAFAYVLKGTGSVTETSVLANAGARPLDRDSVDTRAVEEARTRTGSRITSQSDMGGWPTLAVNTQTYADPANPNAVAAGQTVRTNREVYLEALAVALEVPPVSGPYTFVPHYGGWQCNPIVMVY